MANAKLITYDLRIPETSEDYQILIGRIKQYQNACRVCESAWIVDTTWNAKQIRDDLSRYVDSNDRIFVASLTGEAAWTNISCGDQTAKLALS